jgi:parallel beta-helix repeat protein
MHKFYLFICTIILSLPAFAQTYFVDKQTGNDANNGTSLTSAWKTIQKSMTAAVPGSTVEIKGGTYNEVLTLNVSGTAGKLITFTNYQSDVVVIDGANRNVTLLSISSKKYFAVNGLIFQNTLGNGSAGVFIDGSCSDFTFKNNLIQGIKWTASASTTPGNNNNCNPFVVYGNTVAGVKNIIIENNEIRNNVNGFSENLTLDGNVQFFTISGNRVHDNSNIGIDLIGNFGTVSTPSLDQARNGVVKNNICYNNFASYATSAGIYIDGARDITIEKNICYGNGWGIEVGAEENGTVSNIIVRNNLIYNNRDAGLAVGGYTTASTGQVINSSFTNNVVYTNDTDGNGNGEVIITKASNCSFKQNIIRSGNQNTLLTRVNIAPQTGNTFGYNCWHTANNNSNAINVNWGGNTITNFANFRSSTNDAGSIFQNPLLVNPMGTSANFRLQITSPCKDAGDPDFIPLADETDLDGMPRLSNGRTDIGPYEIQAAVVLAVNFIDPFKAFRDGTQIRIVWTTTNEKEISGFDVERSADGYNFEKITTVNPTSILAVTNNYTAIDPKPLQKINYYRIKQRDINQRFIYSGVLQISYTIPTAVIQLYPIPATDKINIQSPYTIEKVVIKNAMGQVVQIENKPANAIRLNALPKGYYFTEAYTAAPNRQKIVQQIIIQ